MLKQLRYFVTVVDCGSFTEAAEKCFISQSAISQQISALESSLGVALIKRGNRKFSVTPAGEYLYRNGKGLLERAEALRRETMRIGQDEELPLRIGYLPGYEGKELQETIYEFTELYPEVLLSVMKYSHEDLFLQISSDRIDLVFSYQRRAFSEEYENYHLRYIPCSVEISARNEWSDAVSADADQLKDLPCILVSKEDQQDIEQEFYQKTLGIGNSFYFVESVDDARLNVLSNRGFFPVADLGNENLNPAIRRLSLLRRDGKPIQFNYCAFWKKARTNYYIEEFVSIFHSKFVEQTDSR